jgi:hypothetical protein
VQGPAPQGTKWATTRVSGSNQRLSGLGE